MKSIMIMLITLLLTGSWIKASELEIHVIDAGSQSTTTTPVTVGKEMQFEPVAVAEFTWVSNGTDPVKIQFKDPQAAKGIWLNAFELSQWYNQ